MYDKIRAVFFDWEGTLAFWGDPSERSGRLLRLLRAAKIQVDLTVLDQALARLEGHGLNLNSKVGVIKWYEGLLENLGVPDHNSKLAQTLRREYANQSFNLRADARQVLDSFRKGGLRLGIITNHSALVRKQILRNLGDCISCIVVSDEVGFEKPNAEIFAYAARILGLRPSECVYIGDDLEIDAMAALRSGFAAGIWLHSADERSSPYKEHEIWVVQDISQVWSILFG